MDEAAYHEVARIEDSHWWFQGRRAIIPSVLRRWLRPSESRRILDVGCGTGAMLELLQEFGDVDGLDSSSAALEYCRHRLGDGISLAKGSLPNLPQGLFRYDVITAFDVLEHLENPMAALVALREILTRNGVLVCTVPAFEFLWGEHDNISHHLRRYTHRSLSTQLEAAGYRVRWVSYFNVLLFLPIAIVRISRKLMPGKRERTSDFAVTPMPLNSFLSALFACERFLVPHVRFPFGVSLISVAQINRMSHSHDFPCAECSRNETSYRD